MSFDPFCNRKEIGTVFHETKHFMLIYDIRPVVKGHTLIVPKRHVTDVIALSKDEVDDLHNVFAYAIPKVLKIYSPKDRSYDLTTQVGPSSGMTVPHLHFHLVPRASSDEYQGKSSASIYNDLTLNKTHFSREDVEREVKVLREEFGYKQ